MKLGYFFVQIIACDFKIYEDIKKKPQKNAALDQGILRKKIVEWHISHCKKFIHVSSMVQI